MFLGSVVIECDQPAVQDRLVTKGIAVLLRPAGMLTCVVQCEEASRQLKILSEDTDET